MSSAKSILFKFVVSPGERSSIISLPYGVLNVFWRLDIGVIPLIPIESVGLVMFSSRSPPMDLGESNTDLRALEKQLEVKSILDFPAGVLLTLVTL